MMTHWAGTELGPPDDDIHFSSPYAFASGAHRHRRAAASTAPVRARHVGIIFINPLFFLKVTGNR
jgi:hypothetical protein